MKVLELVEAARARNEKTFKNVADQRSAKIVTEALRELVRNLEETDADRLRVAGVGTFMVKEDTEGGKRIVFRPSRSGDTESRGRGRKAPQAGSKRAGATSKRAGATSKRAGATSKRAGATNKRAGD